MAKYKVGDQIQMKKPHACGTNEWTIHRTGIDIRLTCHGCGQEIWMKRPDFEKRLRKIRQADGKFISPLHLPDPEESFKERKHCIDDPAEDDSEGNQA